MDKGVNIGGEDNSVSPLIKFFIDGKQVGKSSVVKKEWFAKHTSQSQYETSSHLRFYLVFFCQEMVGFKLYS